MCRGLFLLHCAISQMPDAWCLLDPETERTHKCDLDARTGRGHSAGKKELQRQRLLLPTLISTVSLSPYLVSRYHSSLSSSSWVPLQHLIQKYFLVGNQEFGCLPFIGRRKERQPSGVFSWPAEHGTGQTDGAHRSMVMTDQTSRKPEDPSRKQSDSLSHCSFDHVIFCSWVTGTSGRCHSF